jgi:hypothetical protein
MKILSILQPWAWLIVNGHKDIENRSWKTDVRSEILIHAGKNFSDESRDHLVDHADSYRMSADCYQHLSGYKWEHWNEMRGGIVGKATIVDCVREHSSPWKDGGSWGFLLKDAKPLPLFPMRGQLGLFEATPAVLAGVEAVTAFHADINRLGNKVSEHDQTFEPRNFLQWIKACETESVDAVKNLAAHMDGLLINAKGTEPYTSVRRHFCHYAHRALLRRFDVPLSERVSMDMDIPFGAF